MGRLLKPILVAAGTLCVALGVIGIFVPLLPTTPFLLLAAACYARSSRRLLHWLHTNRWFGAYLSNYRAGRGIRQREKIVALALLWGTVTVSAIFFLDLVWTRIALVLIAVVVTVHILRIGARRSQPANDDRFSPGARDSAGATLNMTTNDRS